MKQKSLSRALTLFPCAGLVTAAHPRGTGRWSLILALWHLEASTVRSVPWVGPLISVCAQLPPDLPSGQPTWFSSKRLDADHKLEALESKVGVLWWLGPEMGSKPAKGHVLVQTFSGMAGALSHSAECTYCPFSPFPDVAFSLWHYTESQCGLTTPV